MNRLALLLISPVFVGCSSLATRGVVVREDAGSQPALEQPVAAPAAELATIDSLAFVAEPAAPAAESPAQPATSLEPAAAAQEESLYASRFTVKAGMYSADADALDDGFILGVSWMRFLSRIFAVEFELGYIDADGEEDDVDAEVWAMPIMINGRASIPIWVLEAYAGLGIGGFYYDAEAGDVDDDGFLFGGNAFLGAGVNLADAISLGLEAKYYVTEDIDDFDESLDAFALMLTLGFSR